MTGFLRLLDIDDAFATPLAAMQEKPKQGLETVITNWSFSITTGT